MKEIRLNYAASPFDLPEGENKRKAPYVVTETVTESIRDTADREEATYKIAEVQERLKGIEATLRIVLDGMARESEYLKNGLHKYAGSALERYYTALNSIDFNIYEQVQELERVQDPVNERPVQI